MISVDGLAVAELLLVEFEKGAGLSKVGNSYFRAANGIIPQPAVDTSLNQGKLEASNVNVAEEAVRLMLAMRHFHNDAARGFACWKRAERSRGRGIGINPITEHT